MKINFSNLMTRVANNLLVFLSKREWNSFLKSISNVENTQKKLLFDLLNKNKDTLYGKKYDFGKIKTIEQFQESVPLTTYDNYCEYIDLITEGEKNVLTKEKVIMLELSSGSVSSTKYIPYTKSLKKEFQKGISSWIYNLYAGNQGLIDGKSYWSITPINNSQRITSGGIKIGFDEDAEYFGFIKKYMMKKIFSVPKEVRLIEDFDSFKYITLLFLLKSKDLSFISIWNPTFLTILFEPLNDIYQQLIEDIGAGEISKRVKLEDELRIKINSYLNKDVFRAKELIEIFNQSERPLKLIFPNLKLISCWTDGNSKDYIYSIKDLFPNTEIQGKGLIATEGFVSFPLIEEKASILSINSHFFEFIDVETNEIRFANQLILERKYSVVITTGGGFYRYRLQDIIEVVGFKKEAPLIKFIGKEDNISDLFGEKINEVTVSEIFHALLLKYDIKTKFFMLSPEKNELDKAVYVLFVEFNGDIERDILLKFVDDFENELKKNHHYNYCRHICQLEKVKLFKIKFNSIKRYVEVCSKKQKLGNIKPTSLNKNFGWSKIFKGAYVS